jgi:hypothetical protein
MHEGHEHAIECIEARKEPAKGLESSKSLSFPSNLSYITSCITLSSSQGFLRLPLGGTIGL